MMTVEERPRPFVIGFLYGASMATIVVLLIVIVLQTLELI